MLSPHHADITNVWTHDGWLYLAVIIDMNRSGERYDHAVSKSFFATL